MKYLTAIWCIICAPLSFFICWVYDWSLGGAYTSYIGMIGGSFLFLSAILLLFNKFGIAKGFGFVGCGINITAYVILCSRWEQFSLFACFVALAIYSLVTIIPFILLLKLKSPIK